MKKLSNLLFLLWLLLLVACVQEEPVEKVVEPNFSAKGSREWAVREVESLLQVMDPVTRSGEKRSVGWVEDVCSSGILQTRTANVVDTLLYIVNFENEQGYALVGADKRSGGVMAVIDGGSMTSDEFCRMIDSDSTEGPAYVLQQMIAFSQEQISSVSVTRASSEVYYGPWIGGTFNPPYAMLETKWGQGDPYNAECPIKDGKRCLAGCTAIATAQILAYNKKKFGIGANQLSGYSLDWDAILSEMSEPNPTSCPAIARLIHAVGVCASMDYGVDESTSNITNAKKCFQNMGCIGTDDRIYDAGYAKIMIRDRQKPFYLRGTSDGSKGTIKGGHAWVVDGYDTYFRNKYSEPPRPGMISNPGYIGTEYQIMVHCNFGWDGFCDGFYISGVFDLSNGAEVVAPGDNYFDSTNANYWSGNKLIYYQ